MLGCTVENPKVAQQLLSLLLIPQYLFAGFFISPSLIPECLRWCQYLCPLTYAFRLLVLAEFNQCGAQTCDAFFADLSINEERKVQFWVSLIGLFFLFRSIAIFFLKQKAGNFH